MERRTSTISALPDEILCHILSFLPTKTSISTSVLAKRWRFLWAHVPNIDLDDTQHRHHPVLGGASFSDIIYRVMLMYRGQSINHFRLSYTDSSCSEYQLETCIATAIARKVKNLYLDLGNQVRLSPRIFTCKALVELKLYGCGGDITSPSSSTALYLPALKILHLASVVYASDKSLEHLLSGCPVLQELLVVRTNVDPLVFCYISSSTLKKLVLFTNFINNTSYAVTYRVKIDAPALTHLELQDTVSKDLEVGPLTSLIAADVQFHNRVPLQVDVLYSNSVFQLVTKLSNVKTLKLCTSMLVVPGTAFPVLKGNYFKLTSLVLSGDWRFILFFLKHAQNLEVLTIQMVTNDQTSYRFPRLVSMVIMSCLTLIKVDQFRCTQHELGLIAFLLRNAKVLKMMEVYPHPIFQTDFKKKFEALNYISSFQRGSEDCRVVFKD